MKFLNRLRIPMFSSTPASPSEAEIWYDTTFDQLRYKGPAQYPVPVHAGTRFNDFATGRWYQTQNGTPTTSTAAVNRVYTSPFVLPRVATLSGVATEISAAFATTAGTIRLGIYDDDGGRMPTNRIVELTSQAASTGVKVFTSTQVLNPGIYWIATVIQGATGTAGQFRAAQGLHEFLGDPAATPNFNITFSTYYSDTGFSGALPSTFGTVAGIIGGPRFAVRFSA